MTATSHRARSWQRSHWAGAALVALLGLALYLPRLGAEILRSPLEVKYALVAREMLEGTSPLLVPRLFGELYPDKPPLYFWATAALGRLAGGEIHELTARLPAALAAILGLVLLYRHGTDLFGPRVGLLAAAALATSNLFFWYARQGHPDQLLSACVTLACLALWRRLHAGDRRAALGWTTLAYAAMGLGVLSKGLLGLLFPLLAASGYLVATGPLRAVPRRLGLLPGLGISLAVVLAWYGPAVVTEGRGYLYETIVHQHVLRYTRGWVHRQPWYYYFSNFPAGFFPWVLFLPGAVVLGWRRHLSGRGSTATEPEAISPGAAVPGPDAFRFPLAWFVTGFAFLTLSATKRDIYLLPLYPAAALMVGWVWDRAVRTRSRSRWIGIPVALLLVVATTLAVGLVALPRRLTVGSLDPASRVETLVPTDLGRLVAVGLVLVAGAAGLWWAWQRGRPGLAFGTLVVTQAALLLAVAMIRAPQYEARYPVRAFAVTVHAAVPRGRPVLSVLQRDSLLVAFYLRDPAVQLFAGVPELVAARPGLVEPWYALVDGESLASEPPGIHPLAEARFGSGRIVLVRVDPLR